MLWIGLTGGIASGKSTVGRLLKERGYPVIDADQLVRETSRRGTEAFREIVQAFGEPIVAADGELDRKKLGEIAFRDRSKLDALEKILHPRIRLLTASKRAALAADGTAIAFYDVPLLFEKNLEPLFDRIVVVVCPAALQLSRLMSRNSLTREEAERRLSAQIPLEEKAKRGHDVILNDGSPADLALALDRYLATVHQAQT